MCQIESAEESAGTHLLTRGVSSRVAWNRSRDQLSRRHAYAVPLCPSQIDDQLRRLDRGQLLVEQRGIRLRQGGLEICPPVGRDAGEARQRRKIFSLTASDVHTEICMGMRGEDRGLCLGSEKTAVRQSARCGARRELRGWVEEFPRRAGGAAGEVSRRIERRLRQLDGSVRHAAGEGQQHSSCQKEVACKHISLPQLRQGYRGISERYHP